MKKLLSIICLLVLVAGCGEQAPDLGPSGMVKSIGLSTDKRSVDSTGVDQATLTIRAIGSGNVLIPDAEVRLAASAGALGTNSVVTDETGQATVTFDSGLETSNQVAVITASSGNTVSTISINIVGTSVDFISSQTSVLLNGQSSATLTATVRDASGFALPNVSLTLSSSGLGTLTDPVTQSSGVSVALTTDSEGKATAVYTGGGSPGVDTITLSGPDGTQTLTINVTSSEFMLADDTGGNPISLAAGQANVTLTWIDAAGAPVADQTVTFSANQGTFDNNFSSYGVTTNAAGQATVTFTPSLAGNAVITCQDASGSFSADLTIPVQAVNPAKVDLQISPNVVGPADAATIPTATLVATVRDAANNAIANQDVTFSIVAGPGGGEKIDPVVARTNAGGSASSTFFSGQQPSAQNGVTVKATLNSNPAISGTATLTIGQQAARITFGFTNKIAKFTSNSLEIGYAYPVTLLLTDNNGNPIPNQTVSLGLYPLKFFTGFASGTSGTAVVGREYDNEDVNRNGILDPGEDGGTGYRGEDLNGNGVLDTRLNEDLNNNGVLDTAWDEDLNENGVLDTCLSEDLNKNGRLDVDLDEDFNTNGRLDSSYNEDINGNDQLDALVNEDFNGNGVLDYCVNEDLNGNSTLDPGEDFNNNGHLDACVSEDLNNNGILDTEWDEDRNRNGKLDKSANEDLNGNGRLDRNLTEDLNNSGTLETCINEDINGNGVLDATVNEDLNGDGILETKLNEDLNGNGRLDSLNGRLDPGTVATVPDFVVTDENGFAAFNINYAKVYANWVKVELSANTTVSGNQATARSVLVLPAMENDPPYLPSPFNPVPE